MKVVNRCRFLRKAVANGKIVDVRKEVIYNRFNDLLLLFPTMRSKIYHSKMISIEFLNYKRKQK